MLKKKYRLSWGVRFDNDRSFSSPQFIAKVKQNTFLFNRLGVVVSKKIDKRAVVRNRIRRLIYSIVEELHKDIKQGYDIIILIRKNAVGKTREELYLVIRQMFLTEGFLK